jgi:nucleoside-diphosphate-sugar epimerase
MISTPVARNVLYPSVYEAPPAKVQRDQVNREIRTVHRRTSIDGARNLVSAILQSAAVKQLVYFGDAASMFDGIERPNVCEADVPCLPKPWTACHEPASVGEGIVLGANGKKGLATAVIRPALLFGWASTVFYARSQC